LCFIRGQNAQNIASDGGWCGCPLTSAVYNTRSSADADKPRDAFRGQSKSPNMVPFGMLGMVSY